MVGGSEDHWRSKTRPICQKIGSLERGGGLDRGNSLSDKELTRSWSHLAFNRLPEGERGESETQQLSRLPSLLFTSLFLFPYFHHNTEDRL